MEENPSSSDLILIKSYGNLQILKEGEEKFHVCMNGVKIMEGLSYAQIRNVKRQLTPFMISMINAATVQAVITVNKLKPWEKA